MTANTIKYVMNCAICGKSFFAKRKHANTCSCRCRFVLHQLKRDLVHFIDTIEQDIYQLQDNELKVKTKYVNEKKYLDDNGCAFELIDGYSDSNGDLIRVVFRNNGSKYLCVWNDIGDTIEERVYKFG